MFVDTAGDEMKLMRCIGQSAMTCIVSGGYLYPVPRSRTVDWCYAVLPPVPADGMADGCYQVDDTQKLRKMLSYAGSYADIEVASGGSVGDYFLVRDCHGSVWEGPRIKNLYEEHAPSLPSGIGEAVFGGEDLVKLRNLALYCSKVADGGGKFKGIWIEPDGTAVATDGKIMAWTLLREKPGHPMWFPGSLVLAMSVRSTFAVLTLYGGNAWKWASDGLRYYMYRDCTFGAGYVNWRRVVPERRDFVGVPSGALRLGKDKLKLRQVPFRPAELGIDDDVELLLNPVYMELVRKTVAGKGRANVDVGVDRERYSSYGAGRKCLTGPVWFRGGGYDVLVMPMMEI